MASKWGDAIADRAAAVEIAAALAASDDAATAKAAALIVAEADVEADYAWSCAREQLLELQRGAAARLEPAARRQAPARPRPRLELVKR